MRRFVAVSLALAASLGLLPAACLDLADVEANGGVDDAGVDAPLDVVVDTGPALELLPATVPPRPAGQTLPSGKGAMRWFAARKIYSGTIDPVTGVTDTKAWKKLGHDLDGECTTLEQSTTDSSATCKKPSGADSESLVDGDDCRDNAYGRVLSLVVKQLGSAWETNLQAGLANGETTLLLRISDLDDGPDDPFAPGALYLSAPRKSAPHWDGSDEFQIQADSVNGASISDPPIVEFPTGYMTEDQWVSGDLGKSPGPFPIYLVSEITMVTLLTRTVVVWLDAQHTRARGSSLSAVAPRSMVLTDLWSFILDMFSCDTVTASTLVQTFVLPNSDVGSTPPTFQTPGAECGGLSVGGAFQWVPIKAPVELVSVDAGAPVCDAGPPDAG